MMTSSSMNARVADSGLTNYRYPWKWWLKDLEPPEENAPTVFSTFACGGGSSMGYKRAGFRVIGNCEIDPKIAKVYERNLHPQCSYVMDLREFNTLEDLPDELYHLDVLDGSPPCSTFSMAGSREKAWGVEKQFAEGQKLQRLDDLFFTYLDTVDKLRPKAFVAENVTGLLLGNAKGYVNEILKRTREIGYEVQLFKLNAAFMGVPQKRERVFFIGNRMGYQKLVLNFCERPVTFGEARSEFGKPYSGSMANELLKKRRKSDKNIADISLRERGVNSGFARPIFWDDEIASTVTTVDSYRGVDGLETSVDDLRNIQSFPQDYDFAGSNPRFICGMSVPPSMMANIAHEIKEQWLNV